MEQTLTRGEAIELIWEKAGSSSPREALLQLRRFWAASERDVPLDCQPSEMAEWLSEYVDGCCVNDDVRSNGRKDSDETGLAAPPN